MKTLVLLALGLNTVAGFHLSRTSRNVQTANPDYDTNAAGQLPYGQYDDNYIVYPDNYDPSVPGYYMLPDGGCAYVPTPDDGNSYRAEQVSGSHQDTNNVYDGLNGYPTADAGFVDYMTAGGGSVYQTNQDAGSVDYPSPDVGCLEQATHNDVVVDYPSQYDGSQGYPNPDGASVYQSTYLDYPAPDVGCAYYFTPYDGYVDNPVPYSGLQVDSVDHKTHGSSHDNSTTGDGATDQLKSNEISGNNTKPQDRPGSKKDNQHDLKAIQTTTVPSSLNVTSKINTTVG